MAVLQPERIKHRQAIEEIRALKPDVIVVMAYGQILPGDVLEIPKIASLNLHASLLPRWRGAAPIRRRSRRAIARPALPGCILMKDSIRATSSCSAQSTF